MNTGDKLTALRKLLHERSYTAFVLPVADEYLSEYVPAHAMRLTWLTGFSGSAGAVVVTAQDAHLFVDGRYTLQAAQQVEHKHFTVHNIADLSLHEWLATLGGPIAYDPMLHSASEIERFTSKGIELTPLQPNPIDILWADKPIPEANPAFLYPENYAGVSSLQKRTQIVQQIANAGADMLLIASPENINWLLNIRGRDVEFSPILQCYALLGAGAHVSLFLDTVKTQGIAALLPDVSIFRTGEIQQAIPALKGKRLLLDPNITPQHFLQLAQKNDVEVVKGKDPCELAKAVKNPTEIEWMKKVHLQDGAAIATFLCWLEQAHAAGGVDELTIERKLLEYRQTGDGFISPSFATIVGSGPHGAIVHYRADDKSNRKLERKDILLLDSGGQYWGGTTDITRTVALSLPTEEQKTQFTRVLKGHIALARAHFPAGTSGGQLDVLARQYLWEAGQDFDHGTGHGVGACLSVHEGPQRISKAGFGQPLLPGMIISNEPGYYEPGQYGIRIESLVLVTEKQTQGGKAYLGFETITLAPIDKKLIDIGMLTTIERQWLNEYHQLVYNSLKDKVSSDVQMWLQQACTML